MSRVVLCLIFALACGLDSTSTYDVTGVVQDIDPELKHVKIAHDDIPGFMPAMTMTLDVASPQVLDGVLVGSPVRFELERTATTLRITRMTVTGLPDASAGVAGRAGARMPPIPTIAPASP